VADIVEVLWDDQNIAHIALHSVIPPEVEQVVFGDDAVFLDADTPERPGRLGRPREDGRRTTPRRLPRQTRFRAELSGECSTDDGQGEAGVPRRKGGRTMTKKTRPADDQERNAFDDGELDISTLRRVEVSRGQPMSSLAVRFDAADLERLRQRAKAEGVGVTQLVRRWVRDRLDEPEQGDGVDDPAGCPRQERARCPSAQALTEAKNRLAPTCRSALSVSGPKLSRSPPPAPPTWRCRAAAKVLSPSGVRRTESGRGDDQNAATLRGGGLCVPQRSVCETTACHASSLSTSGRTTLEVVTHRDG
jgi:hypothetical protein